MSTAHEKDGSRPSKASWIGLLVAIGLCLAVVLRVLAPFASVLLLALVAAGLIYPHYQRLVDAIHDAGLYHWKHSDGNMYPLLDSIVAAGSDGIDPIDPSGGMKLSVVKEK